MAILIIVIAYWGGRTLNLIGQNKNQKQQIRLLQEKEQQKAKELETLLEKQKQLEKEKSELQKRVQAKVRVASAKAYSLPENQAKAFIYQKESGNRPDAINRSSGACGLGQALPCSKMGCSLQDYACQDAWFNQYCLRRYGSWENAYKFWLSHHWW